MSFELKISKKEGKVLFSLIIFSTPLARATPRKSWGVIPIKVPKKKFFNFILNKVGNKLDKKKGIPPIKR